MKGVGLGYAVGLDSLTNFKFDPSKPYAGCRLCGEVYQGDQNRLGSDAGLSEWRLRHNRQHSDTEHRLLALSGRKFTADAALRMAPLGIIDFDGIVTDSELAHAYRQAPRAPVNDVEGT